MNYRLIAVTLLSLFGTLSSGLNTAHAQGTAFTYQGRLSNGGSPLNGSYDLSFTLYSDASTAVVVKGPVTNSAVIVTNGLFTTLVDFGPGVFVGGSNWLAIAVSPSEANSFVLLNPRQQVTPTPYALTIAGTVNASQVTGLNPAATAPTGMVSIPAGSFTMGNSIGDTDISDANPTNTFVSAFYMDVNLVSLSQWQTVYTWATLVGGYTFVHTGSGKAPNHPVQSVDWYDTVKWCNARSEQAGLAPVYYTDPGLTAVYRTGEVTVYVNRSNTGYRLPTEAEWEKAARGGLTGQRLPWGNTISQKQANYYGSPGGYDLGPGGYNAIGSMGGTSPASSPVGSFAPNGYGLYDMAGNVSEWVWDWYGKPYAGGTDPRGPTSGSFRAYRGGDWNDFAYLARCARRLSRDPTGQSITLGFRAVLPLGK